METTGAQHSEKMKWAELPLRHRPAQATGVLCWLGALPWPLTAIPAWPEAGCSRPLLDEP